ncbi:T9SS type B sorting domain-containing protein [Mangrovibacterium diazotrophicum]|uniref:Gliding motility-associated-like protein n=1 Tax=Mangrovibacterium diazotrophicum TaxID=1261403 RepID=A0A419W727_9BACT|nr:gliding motility-associated C-terminal domain-containing protein [Mangrovibacterium diazotrophicum]RKD91220.1 gliding motility-associated-like protein [Mangrovibacterium diazotrophicum]
MKRLFSCFLCLTMCLLGGTLRAQITANSDGVATTSYSTGPQDNIYIFCSQQGGSVGALTAAYSSGDPANYEWLKYNSGTNSFEAFQSDNSNAVSSTINNLADGCYRVNVVSGGNTETYTAWVFNSWYEVSASISESTCEYFQLTGAFTEASSTYNDLGTGGTLQLYKNVQVKWEAGSDLQSSLLSPAIYNPPAESATYKLTVYDQFGCSGEADVYYESIVPEAAFVTDYNSTAAEAPLTVNFTNQSTNADEYEWFFYRDLYEMIDEAESQGSVSDSIMDVALDQNPVYTYQSTGKYMVKLVATKNSSSAVCRDTTYLDYYIIADSSFIEAPNFFTPNNDGTNETFLIKYSSMKSIDIKIFNRWGKQVFSVSRSNLGTFDNDGADLGWDGKIGGRYASPGVYYYVVEGRGRDDRKRKAQGFFHLFRGK